jgi:hypothetical protein
VTVIGRRGHSVVKPVVRLVGGMLAGLAIVDATTIATANGLTQREIQARVLSVDTASGTLVIAREFRGKTTRLTLKIPPSVRIFACGADAASLDRVKPGVIVSAFYEVVGADGIANLLVIEAPR